MKLYKLSPELGDGDSYTIVEKRFVSEAIQNWLENDQSIGEKFSVEVVEMSQEDYEKLESI